MPLCGYMIIYFPRLLVLNIEGFPIGPLLVQTEGRQRRVVKSTDSGLNGRDCAKKSERSRPGTAILRKAACKVDTWLASGNLDFRMVSSTLTDRPGSLD